MTPQLVRISHEGHVPLLSRFYDEVYLPAFHHQREPLEAWSRQLWGPDPEPYELVIFLAGDELDDPRAARIDGGVVSELYPRSACGLLTYLVVAPAARRANLGRTLLDTARRALSQRAAELDVSLAAVFGEVADPTRSTDPEAWSRLERFQRWGARVVEHAYVQPSLGRGLPRDEHLRLIVFGDDGVPATLSGVLLAAFYRDFFSVTEGISLDEDPRLRALVQSMPGTVALRELTRG